MAMMSNPNEVVVEQLFTNSELREFEADDAVAGRAIGKMLSILFIYTVIAMSIVVFWTFNSVGNEAGRATNTSGNTEQAH